MKRHWVLAVALSLAAVGAPPASTAAGEEDTSGDEIPSSYEQALRWVEAADYEDALETLEALNRSEPGNADMLNMLGYSPASWAGWRAHSATTGKCSPSSPGT